MKPEKLVICGWGPYKEETIIDFEKLNTSGLFLVTGQTGAGKTTIFDAIAYALYGILSGGMREKGTVRSDFADADTKTYVELYMQHRKQRYRISRNPEYLRPKKRKSGENAFTKEKENAVLTMPDGSIIAGNQDVTDKVKELLQMDAKQFCQISMIAQGEFSKMLFADSKEKNAIFRELFGTGIYEKVQGELKRRSTALYDEYKQYKNKMEEDVHLLSLQEDEWQSMTSGEYLDFKRIEEYLADRLLIKQQEELGKKQEEDKLEEDLLVLQKEMEAASQLNARFDELGKADKRVKELEEKTDWAEKQKEKIAYAQKVRVLTLEEQLLSAKEKNVTELSIRIEQSMTDLSENKKEAETLEETTVYREEIQRVYELYSQLQEIKTRRYKLEQQLGQIQEKLGVARKDYETAQRSAEEKNRLYEQADVRYKKAVIGIAARLVKEGEPCPVCGSFTHPQIAQVSEDIPDEKELESWKKEAEHAKEKAGQFYEQALHMVNEEKRCVQNLQEMDADAASFEERLQNMDGQIRAYVKAHDKGVFEQDCARYLELDTLIKEKEKQIMQNKELLSEKQSELESEREVFLQKVKDSGFEDRAAYENAAALVERLEQMQNEYENYQKEYAAAKEVQMHLGSLLKGLEVKDEAFLKEQFEQKQEQCRQCRGELEQIRLLLSQIQHSLEGIRKNGKRVEKISQEYGVVKDLDDLANGNNAKRLVFEQFVLAGYFEKILQAANLRLEKMTDGRYELLRARQVSDGRKKDNLEIMVMDYYTGRQRSVKTLSGGETFKASLALALGMSDCVQAENGGMEVETLFIDEGFGALDEESLDQACNTLMLLAGKNRMVGIISHVAQLRERIEHQIIVEKRNDGSFARVI